MPLADVVTLLIAIDGGTVIGVETACTVMAAALAFEASALDVAVTVTVPAVTPVTLPAASTVATAGLLELPPPDLSLVASAGSAKKNSIFTPPRVIALSVVNPGPLRLRCSAA